MDELHARGELPRVVALLYALDPRVPHPRAQVRAPRRHKEVVDALLAVGLVKRLLLACLLGWCCEDDGAATLASERPFASAVVRFTVQVEVGEGLSPREKREAKLEMPVARERAEASKGERWKKTDMRGPPIRGSKRIF